MRADRLLAILLILQSRGRTTAHKLAEELEVSERTIYRDLTALSTSGVPVYTEKGPGGGIALVEDYRTELTGLTGPEANALLLVQALSPLKDLGLEGALDNAMRKLFASLSEEQRSLSDESADLLYFDSEPWPERAPGGTHVQVLHRCMVERCRVSLTIRQFNNRRDVTLAEPYGLVAKGGDWLLACRINNGTRMLRLEDIINVESQEDCFERDPGFDLQRFWQDWLRVYERNRPSFDVTALVAPSLLPYATQIADQVVDHGEDGGEGWHRMAFTFRSHYGARARLLRYGGAVKVLEPLPLKLAMVDLAEQFIKVNRD